MLIMMTSAVHTSIHAMSPLSNLGGAGVAAGAAAASTAAGAVAAGLSAALSCAYDGSVTAANAKNSASMEISFFMLLSLKRFRAGLAGPDADDLLEVEYEDL